MKKTLLIAGDSFSADWTKKYDGIGWVNMLENDFDVTNVSQAIS
jgi:lysophospholipase L1-like esterase